jgi:hypothetical protein
MKPLIRLSFSAPACRIGEHLLKGLRIRMACYCSELPLANPLPWSESISADPFSAHCPRRGDVLVDEDRAPLYKDSPRHRPSPEERVRFYPEATARGDAKESFLVTELASGPYNRAWQR